MPLPPFRRALPTLLTLATALLTPGCFNTSPSSGGGQVAFKPPRAVNPADVALPQGYNIEPVARDLTFPTGVAFDEQGRIYVVESGYAYGEKWTTPRLIRVEPGGARTVIAEGDNGPWNGVDYRNRAFYVAEGGERDGGRILRITEDGKITALVDNLPSVGDHHTNGPAVGNDGFVYFGQGTATNSGVVGPDNAKFGWLHRHPQFHDIPAHDVKLAGRNFSSDNPLTKDPKDKATTGAYLPFGTPSYEGQVIKGQTLCTGAILRVGAEGGEPEVVAWGLRNPWGLAFSPDGTLFVTENSYDVRGSRPVWGAGDVMWAIGQGERGKWFGWPDFHGNTPLTKSDHYRAPGREPPGFVLAEHPNEPPMPVVKFGVHSSSNGLDFSTSSNFGYEGDAFVAQFGDMAPAVGKVLAPVGFKVVRVNVRDGTIDDFATNRGKQNGPASRLKRGGLERPTAVKFDPDGKALYVVDFGVVTMTDKGPNAREGTGVLWRITREGK